MYPFNTIRKALGVTQAEIASALDVSQGNVSFYEKGQTVPPAVASKLIEFARSRDLPLTYDMVYGAAELPLREQAQPTPTPATEPAEERA